jgi:hypothetical protein
MEEDELFAELDFDAFVKSINIQHEENEKSLQEHFRIIEHQQKEIDRQKQKLYSFVCDWQ